MSRHETIAQCIKDAIAAEWTTDDRLMKNDIRVEDVAMDAEPTFGIIVSPDRDTEDLVGTNERDDISYFCTVYRSIHAMHNEDREDKLDFREEMRKLFHRKRLVCDDGCHLYSYLSFGDVMIPQAWNKNNNSVSAIRVVSIVREARE